MPRSNSGSLKKIKEELAIPAEILENSEESQCYDSNNDSGQKETKRRLKKGDLMHRNYSKDENSDAFKQKSAFDIEEDVIFF
jgi:hypothetical protein